MTGNPRILLASADPTLSGDLSEALDESFGATVDAAETLADARRLLTENDYDLFILDAALEGGALPSVLDDAIQRSLPTILVEAELDARRVLAALRVGVIDVLEQPIDFYHLERIVGATLEARQTEQRDRGRQKRLKELSSRMVKDRRELRQRIDLLCKDLVSAYRRLAERVGAIEDRP
ncbi:MAG: hypothetical protein U1A27_11495 [Phycisphaerae bacterium]